MPFHLVAQQLGVYGGWVRHKRCAKAGAESRLGLGQTDFRAGQFGGKALHKLIHHVFTLQY